MAEVGKYGQELLIANLLQSPVALSEALRREAIWSPGQAKARRSAMESARREERRKSAPLTVTAERLIEKLGWSDAYAEHFVQPYCTCEDTADGWDYCAHARDEDVTPY